MNPKIVNALSAMAILAAPPSFISAFDHAYANENVQRVSERLQTDFLVLNENRHLTEDLRDTPSLNERRISNAGRSMRFYN